MKIKIDSADRFFSYYVREKADWTCERCGKKYERKSQGLHASHFFGRKAQSTRYSLENVSAHCFFCHQHFTSNPFEFSEWKKKQIGQKRFDALVVLHNTFAKKDREWQAIVWKTALKELCEEKGVDFKIYK